MIVFFFLLLIDLLRLFQKRSFVLSSEHENQNVATIGTLLDQTVNNNVLVAFQSVVLDRDKTRSLVALKSHIKTQT